MGDDGRQTGDRSRPFYLFNLEERIPARHLLRLTNPTGTRVFAGVREGTLLGSGLDCLPLPTLAGETPHQISFLKLLT